MKKSSSENGLLNLYRRAIMASPVLARRSAGKILGGKEEVGTASKPLEAHQETCSKEHGSSQSLDSSTAAGISDQVVETLPAVSTQPPEITMPSAQKPAKPAPTLAKVQQDAAKHETTPSIQQYMLMGGSLDSASKSSTSSARYLEQASPGSILSRKAVPPRQISFNANISEGCRSQETASPSKKHDAFEKPHALVRSKTSALASVYCPDDSSDEDAEEETRKLTDFLRRPKHHRSNSMIHDGTPSGDLRGRAVQSFDQGDLDGFDEATELSRRSSYHLTNSHAAIELFLRLNHARQTLDFVKRQASSFAQLDKCQMGVWEAIDTMNELREYEAAMLGYSSLEPDLPLREHAIQTAELCRLAYPDTDWMHLVGLIHGLGKLLAHRSFGALPQWAVCGESFPVGCRFEPCIQGAQFFTANPDRRRKQYNTPVGIYQPHCGLKNVFMSWSGAEYLYLILLLNGTRLPVEALFLIRHQKFLALTRSQRSAYMVLLNEEDQRMLPLLCSFQKLTVYKRVKIPQEVAYSDEKLRQYYDGLIEKYIGSENLLW